MSRIIKSTLIALLLAGLLVACAAPGRPTPTPISTDGNPGAQVTISIGEGNETLNATITGNGDVNIIIANTLGNDPSRWAPLVDALVSNENLRVLTFAYRSDNEDTHVEDTIAVFDYLRTGNIDRIICVGAGFGSTACAGLKEKPEVIGMVFFAANIPAIEADFPKLFLTADADPFGLTGSTQRGYEQSAEPKIFKSYVSGRHGPSLVTDPNVGAQVLADVTHFINGIVSGQ